MIQVSYDDSVQMFFPLPRKCWTFEKDDDRVSGRH